jgi:hypothetical protein
MRTIEALLVNDASLLGHHGSALVSEQAKMLAAAAGIHLQTGTDWPTAERILAGSHAFRAVIVNGEGSVHHDSHTARRIARLGHDLADRGLPAFLINASVEANSEEIYAGLGKFRSIYVRDFQSQKVLAGFGIASNVVHDLTLTWRAAPLGARSGNVLVTDASDPVQSTKLYRYAQRTGCVPITLRTAPPAHHGLLRRRAQFELKRFAARFTPGSPWKLRYAGAVRDFDRFALQLAGSSGIISGRFHAICLAIRMKIPFLAVSAPTSKIMSLLSETGLSGRMIDIQELDGATSPREVPPFSAAELDAIGRFLTSTEQGAEDMFDNIAAQLDAAR